MNNKLKLTLIRLVYLTQVLSLIIFAYIIGSHILNLLSVDQAVDPRAFELDYLRVLIAIGLTTSVIASALLIALKKMDYINFFKQPAREKATYIFIAGSLAYFFATGRHTAVTLEILIFMPVFLFLLFVTPTLIEAFTLCNVLEYRQTFAKLGPASRHLKHNFTYILLTAAAIIVFGVNALLVTFITMDYINGNTAREAELRKYLHVVKVSPAKTTQAKKVIIYGYNMGWNADGRSKILSSGGSITTGVWNNTEVEFEVPLHMKEGKSMVWVQKSKKDDDPESEMVTSNKVSIEIAPRFEYYPQEGDNFATRQLKKIKRFLFL